MKTVLGWTVVVAVMMGSGLAAPMAIAALDPGLTRIAQNETPGPSEAASQRAATITAPASLTNPTQITLYALDAAEQAANAARQAVRQTEWAVARVHAQNLNEWLELAARVQQPTGEAATRWDFAAREARRLNAALFARNADQARFADAALTLALADTRSLIGAGGGGGGPVATPTPDPKRPEIRYEDVPLDNARPGRTRL